MTLQCPFCHQEIEMTETGLYVEHREPHFTTRRSRRGRKVPRKCPASGREQGFTPGKFIGRRRVLI